MASASFWESKSNDLLTRMRNYHTSSGGRIPYPPIDQRTATLLTLFFTILYVAPFYLSSKLRSSQTVNRNSPSSIKARSRAVLLTCVISTAITLYVLAVPGLANDSEIKHVLGLWPIDLYDVAKTMLLVCVLFIGPLFEVAIVEDSWREWGLANFKQTVFDSWTGWRNLVVGPVSEELVFRSLAISLFLLAQADPRTIVFGTPLIFGLAHLHHLSEWILMHQRNGQSWLSTLSTPNVIIPGVARTLFQLVYTSLFGFFVAFVFLRTGNIYSCILAHSFCNWMGLPRFWGRVGRDVGDEIVDVAEGKKNDSSRLAEDLKAGTGQSRGVKWTVTYYVLLAFGAYGFSALLWPLTESSNALIYFY